MNCPYCGYHFDSFMANTPVMPPLAPMICFSCGAAGMLDKGEPRKITDAELAQLKLSPAWRDILGPAQTRIRARFN